MNPKLIQLIVSGLVATVLFILAGPALSEMVARGLMKVVQAEFAPPPDA